MIRISEIMPVRFYKNKVYNKGEMKYRNESYIKNQEWLIGNTIMMQISREPTINPVYFKVYEDDNLIMTTFSYQLSDIEDFEVFTFNIPVTLGKHIYTIEYGYDNGSEIKEGEMITDCINVKEELENHIRINWSNENVKNWVRYATKYMPFTYIRAEYKEVTTEGDFETMTFSDGQKELLKSTQRKKYSLKAYLLRNSQAVSLSLIAGSDNITINYDRVIFDKPPQIKAINNEPINEVEAEVYIYDWGMFNEY